MRPPVSKSLLALVLAAGLCPVASSGQKNKPEPKPAPPPRANHPNANPKAGRPNVDNRQPVMPDAIARWNAMKPDVRAREMAKLPPEQRQRLQERIDAFNKLPKEEQIRRTERLDRFNQLPPAQKQAIRQSGQQFNSLPPDRKQAVRKELGRLDNMSDEQRSKYFASDQFHNKFSPSEQEIVQNLSKITPHQM